MHTILCVDDDRYLVGLLCHALDRLGYTVCTAHSGAEARRLLNTRRPDLVLLDCRLPDAAGGELCRRFRAEFAVPVILMSRQAGEAEVLAGFVAGADDYLSKPFSVPIAVARIRAVLCSISPRDAAPPAVYRVGTATFDAQEHVLRGADGTVKLTRTESGILHLLQSHPQQVFSAQAIQRHVWNTDEGPSKVVKTHVHHLRAKLAAVAGDSCAIATVPGEGYVFRPASALAVRARTG